jgi:hypothetical protein
VSDDLRFTFALMPAEQARAALLVSERVPWGRLQKYAVLPFLILPFLAALIFRWPLAALWPFVILLGLGVLLIYLTPLVQRRREARVLKDMPELRDLTYRFAADGVHVFTAVTSGHLTWPAVREAVETDDMFLLFLGARYAYYIPKRAVAGQAPALRDLLHASLGTRAAKVGTGSFAPVT